MAYMFKWLTNGSFAGFFHREEHVKCIHVNVYRVVPPPSGGGHYKSSPIPMQCSCPHVLQFSEVFWIESSRYAFASCRSPGLLLLLPLQSSQLPFHHPNKGTINWEERGDWDHTLCRALVLLKQSPWLLGTILDGSPLQHSIPACWHSFCRPRKDDKPS